jgi:glucose-1-phosphate adenylyltransferase
VLILSADHVYKMNYQHMLEWHDAEVTVATAQIDPGYAGRFGIVVMNGDCAITGFEEKPQHSQPKRSQRTLWS